MTILSVSLAQPSLPAKTHQIPAEAKATPAFIICVCMCYKDKAYFWKSIFSATTGRILLKFETSAHGNNLEYKKV